MNINEVKMLRLINLCQSISEYKLVKSLVIPEKVAIEILDSLIEKEQAFRISREKKRGYMWKNMIHSKSFMLKSSGGK